MSEVEHRHLRSALEFALLVAAEGQKRRPPLHVPKELKPFLSKQRIAAGSLGRLRRIIEADDTFRSALSAGAVPELVDEVGRLWLAGRSGWEQRAQELLDAEAAESESKDLQRDLKRAEKRRLAAEQATARVQAEVLVRDQTIAAQLAELDDLRADVAKATEVLAEVRTELIDTRNELRHARDREASATRRAEAASERLREVDGPTERAAAADDVSTMAAAELRAAAATRQRLDAALDASRSFASEMERLLGIEDLPSEPERSARVVQGVRVPVALPGGVISTSAQAAEHLVRSDALILVDGYNVAKLGWPGRSLEEQREALIARTENLARRHGADVSIVFDGDSVVGAHAGVRRTVRVVFSPSGVTADDVIRDEVERLPTERRVVVVTNDREIVDDVRRWGANVVPSNAFIATL